MYIYVCVCVCVRLLALGGRPPRGRISIYLKPYIYLSIYLCIYIYIVSERAYDCRLLNRAVASHAAGCVWDVYVCICLSVCLSICLYVYI